LIASDFVFWGRLKEKVFCRRLEDIEELKAAFRQVVRIVAKEILEGVWTAVATDCSSALQTLVGVLT
jgi:hypothetical protein